MSTSILYTEFSRFDMERGTLCETLTRETFWAARNVNQQHRLRPHMGRSVAAGSVLSQVYLPAYSNAWNLAEDGKQ